MKFRTNSCTFGRDKMLYVLRGFAIHNKTYKVKSYPKYCSSCGVNRTERAKPTGDYEPIRPENRSP